MFEESVLTFDEMGVCPAMPLGKQVSKPELLSTHPKKQLILKLLLMLKHG